MKRFYFARHGETMWNLEHKIQGWGNSPLTERGKKQAEKLKHRLCDVPFDAAFVSPSGRAVETAGILLSGRSVPTETKDGLREISFGDWEQMTYSEVNAAKPLDWYCFWHYPSEFRRYDHGEDFYTARARLNACFQEIAAATPANGNFLVISHAIALKLLISAIRNRPIERLWEGPFYKETALSIVEWHHDGGEVLLEGDISHLEG